MSWDLLLHWMTHVGASSWAAFRNAVGRIAPSDAELDRLCRSQRLFLSDMGHADFFIEGSRQWRALPPVLAGLATEPGAAVLTGCRTPRLMDRVAAAAEAAGCRVSIEDGAAHAATVRLHGAPEALSGTARLADVSFVMSYSAELCRTLTPVAAVFGHTPEERLPINWATRSFDFSSLTWVDGLLRRSACEISSPYGAARYYLQTGRGRFLRMPKREAVFAAAMLQRVKVLRYDPAARRLSTPIAAPLPEIFARTACLCAGEQGRSESGFIVFKEVPPEVAAVLMVAAGQPYTGLRLRGAHGTEAEQGNGQSV